MLSIEIFNEFNPVVEAAAALCDSVLYSAPFLRFLRQEHQGKVDYLYVVATRNGSVCGFVPIFIQRTALPFCFDPAAFYSPGSDDSLAIPELSQTLLVGVPMRLRSWVFAPSEAERELIISGILRFAADHGYTAVVFPFVHESDLPLTEALSHHGFHKCLYDADFYSVADGPTFEAYLDRLPWSARRLLRKERRHFERTNLTVHTIRPGLLDSEECFRLHCTLMSKYGHQASELSPESYVRIGMLPDSVFLATKDEQGRIVGYCWSIFDRREFHVLRYAPPSSEIPHDNARRGAGLRSTHQGNQPSGRLLAAG
jgi:hypothetical protein